MGGQIEQAQTHQCDGDTGQPGERAVGGEAANFAQQQLGSLQQTRFLQTSRPAPRSGRGNSHKNRWLVMAVVRHWPQIIRDPGATDCYRRYKTAKRAPRRGNGFARQVLAKAHSPPSFREESGVMFTMNSCNSVELAQKDKTLGEPPLGPGSPEVAHR